VPAAISNHLNNADRDALHEPWRVRSVFARCAFELQENDEVRVTLFGLRKLPYTHLAPSVRSLPL
jgi:hypothetical protein